jgi:sec-independent protein translocase protein TatA
MFDPSAPHIIILVVVVLLLFGSSRLPGAASALGRSMHIFRRSVQGLDSQDTAANPAPGATALPASPALDPGQQQLADLQRQVEELQRQSAASGNGQAGQSQTHQPL